MKISSNKISRLYCYLFMIFKAVFVYAEVPSKESQILPEKAFLGVVAESRDRNLPVVIQRVLANSTAENLGLKVGDQLQTMNGIKINDFGDLLTILKDVDVGEIFKVTVARDNKKINLIGTMVGRPREKSDYAQVDYSVVNWNNQRMRSITYTPNTTLQNNVASPAIFYLQGYTCDSIDYAMIPNFTSLQLIKQFVKAGFVVHRVEKLGVGESLGTLSCDDIDFSTEVAAFVAGLHNLKQRDTVNAKQVYLWGHSLGVLYAPAMAQQEPVAGIVGYGGVVKPWYNYMLDIYAKQSVLHFNLPVSRAKSNASTMQPFLHDWLKTDKSLSDILENQTTATGLISIDGETVLQRHYTYFREVNQVDFYQLWRKLNVPVLMMHGSLDIQAIDENWALDISASVNQGGHSLGQALVVENVEHALMHYKNAEEYQLERQTGKFNPTEPNGRYDKKIGEITIDWINNNILKEEHHEPS